MRTIETNRSWTHFRVDRRNPRYCHVTFDHPPINTITATTVAELSDLIVDLVTLPDNSELGPPWNDFLELFGRPAVQAQSARLRKLGLNTDSQFERSLGGRLLESLPDDCTRIKREPVILLAG